MVAKMEMKKAYEAPMAQVIKIEVKDTVRTISGITEGDGGDVLMNWFFGG